MEKFKSVNKVGKNIEARKILPISALILAILLS
jgi:hypothetical protein